LKFFLEANKPLGSGDEPESSKAACHSNGVGEVVTGVEALHLEGGGDAASAAHHKHVAPLPPTQNEEGGNVHAPHGSHKSSSKPDLKKKKKKVQ